MSHPRLDIWRGLGVAGGVAVAILVLALLVVATQTGGVGAAVLAPGIGAETASEEERQAQVERYEQAMRGRLAQIAGRSLFHTPPAPSEEEAPEVVEEEPDEDRPAPARYGGPDVIAVVNGSVWFKGGDVVRIGEESGGVRVVNVDAAPWSVRLEWRDVGFDVELFERTTPRFLVQETGDSP